MRRSPCSARHPFNEKLARVTTKDLKTMAPVALEGGSVSELNTGMSKLGFGFGQSHLLLSVLELKEWLVGRVGDDNDIVVDDLQVSPNIGRKV